MLPTHPKVIGIIPLKRTIDRKTKTDPFEGTYQALEAGKTLILFPEGSRGEPEKMSSLKGGVARLAKRYPDVQIIPVFMHGLGKALPRGEALLVPFFCDVFIGEALPKFTSKPEFMASLESSIHTLAEQAKPVEWE